MVVRRVLALTIVLGGGFLAVASANSVPERKAPPWLKARERESLRLTFGGATPLRTHHIWYPRKIAVVWEFRDAVSCHGCSHPEGACVCGRVIRVSFDRRTHRQNGAIHFCDAPLRCLRR